MKVAVILCVLQLTQGSSSYEGGDYPTKAPTKSASVNPTKQPTPSPTKAPSHLVYDSYPASPTKSPPEPPSVAPSAARSAAPSVAHSGDDGSPLFTLAPTTAPTLPALPSPPSTVGLAIYDLWQSSGITIPPTLAPTPYPTLAGYSTVQQEKKVSAMLVSDVRLPGVTAEQARLPIMRKVLEDGFAKSLGLNGGAATLTSVDSVAVVGSARRFRHRLRSSRKLSSLRPAGRRRLTAPALSFEVDAGVTAGDSSGIAALASNIEAVLGVHSGSGTLLAFLKSEAAALGVLTTALAAVPDNTALLTPVLATHTRTVIVVVQVQPTPAPTRAPTAVEPPVLPTMGDETSLSDEEITALILCACAAVFIGLYLVLGGYDRSLLTGAKERESAKNELASTNKLVWRHDGTHKVRPTTVAIKA